MSSELVSSAAICSNPPSIVRRYPQTTPVKVSDKTARNATADRLIVFTRCRRRILLSASRLPPVSLTTRGEAEDGGSLLIHSAAAGAIGGGGSGLLGGCELGGFEPRGGLSRGGSALFGAGGSTTRWPPVSPTRWTSSATEMLSLGGASRRLNRPKRSRPRRSDAGVSDCGAALGAGLDERRLRYR